MTARRETSKSRSDAPGRVRGDTREMCPPATSTIRARPHSAPPALAVSPSHDVELQELTGEVPSAGTKSQLLAHPPPSPAHQEPTGMAHAAAVPHFCCAS
ncbi:hypothetical protein AV530_000441 [Patagioenas fasciata monilis]|uniref:Uncharacterized protein n=1 Tax=Patagioenas fasciata monilis TaxID=372326 RepID=A0A1V4K198_PATFA|nr:hypothetical protein AV530_000441 [Patagioenas fasciata monilis]